MIPSSQSIVPTLKDCSERAIRLEQEFEVSLKPFLNIKLDSTGHAYFEIVFVGSGELFDHLPLVRGEARARLISAFEDPFTNAIWHCLNLLEHNLGRAATGRE